MRSKNTDELRNELSRYPSLEQFLKDNAPSFVRTDFSELLHSIFRKTKLSKAALAKRSGTSEVYLHQLFSGKRTPSRNRLLCLCIGLGASLDESQELLRRSEQAMLYPKSRRDAIIMYGILHDMDLVTINDRLFDADEEALI